MHPFLRIALLSLFVCAPLLTAHAAELKVGDQPPDVLGKDIKGTTVKLSDYPGKVVVVSFWASWCAPCRKEIPVLESLQRVAAPHGVHVLAVNWGEERQVFRKIVKALPTDMQMRMVSDATGRAGRSFGVTAIPHMVMIGKDGKVAFVNVGFGESVVDRMVDAVNELIAADPEPAVATEVAAPAT